MTSNTIPHNLHLTGMGVSPGLAIGQVRVYRDIMQLEQEFYTIKRSQVAHEFDRIEQAFADVLKELAESEERVEHELNREFAGIFRMHQEILRDPKLLAEIRTELGDELVNAEQIVKSVFRRLEGKLRSMEYSLFRNRGDDMADLCRRLIRSLSGIHVNSLQDLPAETVLVAKRLLPSDTVWLSRHSVAAIVVEYGGPTSHAAILTREMGIPAVSQIEGITDRLVDGTTLCVDGTMGSVIMAPDVSTETAFRERIQERRACFAAARARCHEPATTQDDEQVAVMANIGRQEDALLAAELGADGIGLFRLEHGYFSRKALPSPEDVFAYLRRTLEPFRNTEATIRLLDTGADKKLPYLEYPPEPNPALGRRGVRLLLAFPDLVLTQLRALLLLSQERPVRILVPMVTRQEDMQSMRTFLARAAEDMCVKELPPLGAMIETPAAALCVRDIAAHADFCSIGSNDLTQYAMAAGRENAFVADYFDQNHPAVIRLMSLVAAEVPPGCPVEVCGEAAGDLQAIPGLLRMGVRTLSVAPLAVPVVKDKVRSLAAKQEPTSTPT